VGALTFDSSRLRSHCETNNEPRSGKNRMKVPKERWLLGHAVEALADAVSDNLDLARHRAA